MPTEDWETNCHMRADEERMTMSRSIAAESEELLGVVRTAVLSHEEQYYAPRIEVMIITREMLLRYQ